ncbi:hypothetical protein ACI3LY_004283 [Candidozyma auris]|uniref:Thioesterase domain-containing protein n=1 Tax=Candidozyma auris TaxID=498019 RepID=A0A2H0ZCG2_CANAR|nr:hypothetical protein QG37_01160 [[Candida] auris]PIS48329.1 hypothetical protein B9J08_005019 [[Candida] auris]PIS48941.1 hypothetical protein CJI97_005102 [[Candida] auris]PSK74811.1 hypothetical protein CJJ07_005429 [[Candida] auris]GBL48972.1 hypothetical protein CAJCM15448_12460 [[Candida] auris]
MPSPISFLRAFSRFTTPIIAFGAGVVLFPAEWRKSRWEPRKLTHFNEEALEKISKSDLFKQLESNPSYKMYYSSESFPRQHHSNYVSRGMLFGPDLFEVDPVVFLNESEGELTAFYHLGKDLVSGDGMLHNGITATILDEGLCACGFSSLPSKRGVTANLTIDFKNQAQPQSTVVLRAKVAEAKGRKVVIDGTLSTFPTHLGEKPMEIASAKCVLVEPKWFKYFRWLQI